MPLSTPLLPTPCTNLEESHNDVLLPFRLPLPRTPLRLYLVRGRLPRFLFFNQSCSFKDSLFSSFFFPSIHRTFSFLRMLTVLSLFHSKVSLPSIFYFPPSICRLPAFPTFTHQGSQFWGWLYELLTQFPPLETPPPPPVPRQSLDRQNKPSVRIFFTTTPPLFVPVVLDEFRSTFPSPPFPFFPLWFTNLCTPTHFPPCFVFLLDSRLMGFPPFFLPPL